MNGRDNMTAGEHLEATFGSNYGPMRGGTSSEGGEKPKQKPVTTLGEQADQMDSTKKMESESNQS